MGRSATGGSAPAWSGNSDAQRGSAGGSSGTSSLIASTIIGSKAKGNADVERAAKARRPTRSPPKSSRPETESSAKWKRRRWLGSRIVRSESRTGRGSPHRSVAVTCRSSCSASRVPSPFDPASIARMASQSFAVMRADPRRERGGGS
jgi:hypothetical protein